MHFSQLHKSDGLVYNILVHPCLWGLHAMMRRIELYGKEKIPLDKPIIIAANHPTAFIDPILLCALLDQPIYNMTRGDIFNHKLASKLLYSCNMFPVYRAKDGYYGPRRNDEVFDYVFNQLAQRKTISVFVEGQHHLDHKVKPAQKGVAIIAQNAYFRIEECKDLEIFPVGINYLEGDKSWDEVSIIIGDPIKVSDFFEADQQDSEHEKSQVPTNLLLQTIDRELKKVALHLEDKNDFRLFDLVKVMIRSERHGRFLPQVKSGSNRTFLAEQAAAQKLNQMPEAQKDGLRKKARLYSMGLKKASIEDRHLVRPDLGNASKWLLILVCFLPFVVGYIGATPSRLAANLGAKKFAGKREFKTSIMLGFGLITGLIWYIAIAIICFFTHHPYMIALGLSLPLLGWFTNIYKEWWQDVVGVFRASRIPQKGSLLELREELRNWVMVSRPI